MFSPQEREAIRSEIVELARGDNRVSGCALTGSASLGQQDVWSDIDLSFGIRDGNDLRDVLDAFSDHLRQKHAVAHYFDISFGTWVYRVFFLENTLQIDLALVPAEDFCAISPSFRLLFGECVEKDHLPPPQAEPLIGWAWLYALHVRTAIARGRYWQAVHMLNGMRDHVFTLASLRHGLETAHGRGIHSLPPEETTPLESSLVSRLDPGNLIAAFQVITRRLIREVGLVDQELANKLGSPLFALAGLDTD